MFVAPRTRWRALPGLLALLLPLMGAGLLAGSARAEKLTLQVDTPQAGDRTDPAGKLTLVAGRAFAHDGDEKGYDIVFALDTSGSTRAPAGADIDGDGRSGRGLGLGGLLGLNTDPGDSVLHAETLAVEAVLEQLHPRQTRVGLVTFNNDSWVDAPLTYDYEEVRMALRDALDRGPDGGTNIRAAILRASVELLGTRSAVSHSRRGASRFVVLVTDGKATLPYGNSGMMGAAKANEDAAVDAAITAAKRQIRIHTFAVGAEAIGSQAPRRIAHKTQGRYTAVRDPSELPTLFAKLDFSELEELRVRNLTLGETAPAVDLEPDGAFAALVPTRPGVNELEVYARSRAGTVARKRIRIGSKGKSIDLTAEQRLARARLIEQMRMKQERGQATRALEVEVDSSERPDVAAPPESK